MSPISPDLRNDSEIRLLKEYAGFADENPESAFGARYGTGRWTAWVVHGKLRIVDTTYLILKGVGEDPAKRKLMLSAIFLPDSVCTGSTVFQHRNWLSVFDFNTMASLDIEMRTVLSSRKLLDILFGIDSTN